MAYEGNKRNKKVKDAFDQETIDLARVTRVMAGGKRMRFRATVAIGNRSGMVGLGIAKGADVSIAMNKAATQARKNLIRFPLFGGTVTHELTHKFKSARIILRPARSGAGLKAGGSARIILELAGVRDIVCKIHGSTNKVVVSQCLMRALSHFKNVRGKGFPTNEENDQNNNNEKEPKTFGKNQKENQSNESKSQSALS